MPQSIFLAEDDLDDQELLHEAIMAIDKTVELTCFTNGIKLVEHLETVPVENLPCLIILDYNIPELNGEEILKHLNNKEQFNNIPKVIWSTSNSPLYKSTCLSLGAKAYFEKPPTFGGFHAMAIEMLKFCS
jgi:CheY-like chemotaxis protein